MAKDQYVDGFPDTLTMPLILAVRGQLFPSISGIAEKKVEQLIMKTAADAYNIGKQHGAKEAMTRLQVPGERRKSILKSMAGKGKAR